MDPSIHVAPQFRHRLATQLKQGILDHSYHSAPQRSYGTLTVLDLPLIITLIPALALHRDVGMMKLCELYGRRARLVVLTS